MAQKMQVQYIRLYTDGSTALKPEPVYIPHKTAPLPKVTKAKCKKIFVDPVAMLSIGVAFCLIIMMCVGFAQLNQARAEVAAMESYIERLEDQHSELSAQYRSGYNLEEVRQNALALNMIPAEQAARVTIQIPAEPEQVTEPTLWERIDTFLTGLFA